MRRSLEPREIEALRAAARQATEPAEPDWSRLDRALERAARDLAALPPPGRRAVPARAAVAATAAAAAAVVAAFWLSAPDRAPGAPGSDFGPAVAGSSDPGPLPTPRRERSRLGLTLVDSLDLDPPPAAGPVPEGSSLAVPDPGELRLALGAGALVELGPATAASAWSLDEQAAALSLESGTLFVDVPPGVLARELTVVADHATFSLLCGSAVFDLRDGLLEVRVIDGEVGVEDGGGTPRLPGGSFARWSGGDRAPLVVTDGWSTAVADPPGREPPDERRVDGPSGTLPRAVIRRALDRVTPKIRACYEGTLKRHPRATAQVSARLRVDAGGAVAVTGLEGAGSWPGLRECLADALRGMSFPPPVGGPVDVILPLRLIPEP
jgi:hypothetical protein